MLNYLNHFMTSDTLRNVKKDCFDHDFVRRLLYMKKTTVLQPCYENENLLFNESLSNSFICGETALKVSFYIKALYFEQTNKQKK